MTGPSLEHALGQPSIPASPAIVAAALEAPESGTHGERLGLDPAVALAVIEAANRDRPVHERVGRLAAALGRLDARELRTVLLAVPVSGTRDDDPDAIDFDFTMFRSRAIRGSVAARQLAQVTGAHDPEESSTAGLLQDIGMVALHHAFGDRYLQVLDIAGHDHRNLGDVEQRTLRLDHALVGAELAARAGLPAMMVAAIRHHHHHQSAGRDERRLAAVLELASIAALAVEDESLHAEDATARFRRCAHAWLGLPPHEAIVLLEEIRAESAHRLTMSGVGVAHDPESLARRIADARRVAGLTAGLPPAAGCTRDPWTGLADRESFLERLDAALGVDRPNGGSVAVIVASVDDLRQLNVRLGVRGGDALLRTVAHRLAAATPSNAAAFRLVGGQFAILGPGMSPLEARRLADDLRRAITSDLIDIAGERSVRATISVGVAVDRLAPEHAAADVLGLREGLVRRALAALAAAESAGRNRTEVFRDDRDAA